MLCFLLIGGSAHAIAPESPLEVASGDPLPVIVIPNQSYHWEAQLISGKLSEKRAQKQETAVVYFAKNENLFKKVKIGTLPVIQTGKIENIYDDEPLVELSEGQDRVLFPW